MVIAVLIPNQLPAHVVLVTMGAPGGIGRYEQLLAASLCALAETNSMRIYVLQLATRAPTSLPPSSKIHFFVAHGNRLLLLLAFVATLARHREAVVIFTHVNLARLCIVTWPLGLPVRYAVMGYGIDVWGPLSLAKQWPLRRASVVLAISSYTAEKLVEMQGIPRSRIQMLPYGYRGKQASDWSAVPAMEKVPSLLTVTRLDTTEVYKGVDTVIRSLPLVLTRYPSLRYTLIGGGGDRQRLQELADELGVSDSIVFASSVPDDALMAAYISCDVFVLPSKKEGLGIVYLEAMAHAKPVVAARAGGVPDVVVDGETGLLIEFGDVTGLAGAVLRLLEDADLRARLGNAGHDRLVSHFSYQQFSDRLRSTLQTLAKGLQW